jgi:hypothetical protein
MQSKQVNFFLTVDDQDDLINAFRARVGEFVIIDSIAEGGRLRLLQTAEIKRMGAERLKVYLARPNDVALVRLNHLQHHPHETVDIVRSPIVEFDRCYHRDHQLRRGRLYMVGAYYDDDVLLKKDDGFLKWANALITTARRRLTKGPESFFYFGRNALELKRSASARFVG